MAVYYGKTPLSTRAAPEMRVLTLSDIEEPYLAKSGSYCRDTYGNSIENKPHGTEVRSRHPAAAKVFQNDDSLAGGILNIPFSSI